MMMTACRVSDALHLDEMYKPGRLRRRAGDTPGDVWVPSVPIGIITEGGYRTDEEGNVRATEEADFRIPEDESEEKWIATEDGKILRTEDQTPSP